MTTELLHLDSPPGSRSTGAFLARASVVAATGFALCVVVAGFVDPEYSQRGEAISALASRGSHAAGVMIVGFVLLAVTALAAGSALWGALRGKAGRTGAALVVLAGALTAVAGFARQSCSSLQQSCLDRESAGDVTGSHVLHNLVSLVLFVLLVVAGFLLAAACKRDPRFTSMAGPARVVAFLSLVFMIWFGSAAFGDWGGLVQRVFVLLAFGLPVVLAVRVTRVPEVAA